MKKDIFYSLRFRIMVTVLGMFALLGGSVLYNGYHTIRGVMVENVRSTVVQTSNILNLAVTPYIQEKIPAVIGAYLDELIVANKQVAGEAEAQVLTYVVIVDESGERLAQAGNPPRRLPEPDALENYAVAVERGTVHKRQPLLMQDNSVGYLQFGLSTARLHAATQQALQQGLWLVGLGLLVSASVVLYFGFLFAKRIDVLIHASSAIAAGDYTQRAVETGHDEITQLAHHFNLMAEAIRERVEILEANRVMISALNDGLEFRVDERTRELAAVNQTLQQTIENLQLTHASLVRSEKLASLGSLVAGVAHELNTPLGNALISATTLEDSSREFMVEMEAGIKRSSLHRFLSLVQSSNQLVVRNLTRAADLVISFKHVAVDQTSALRRNFNLNQVVHDVVDTLRHTFKHTSYNLDIDIPDGIVLNSYPGPLGQVLTNLINNALLHGFAGRSHGQMHIYAHQQDAQRVILEFSDDGIGVSAENLPHIFDPFFTTRLGQGGSGLGLNITHNIVEGVLGGTIQVQSGAGKGARFILDIPLQAPKTKDAVANLT